MAPVRTRDTTKLSPAEIACERIIKRSFSPTELPYLVEAIFPNQDKKDAIRSLLEDDTQAFIDMIDEALETLNLSLKIRKKCITTLYKTCGTYALVPSAMKISARYNPTDPPLYRGGFGEVWKGEYCGREVAVKVIKTYSNSELKKVMGSFCKEIVTWKALRHPNVVPLIGVKMSNNYFAMISEWMVNGNINDFLKENPDTDRLGLVHISFKLMDVTRGLIYVHDQGMIHGDLKGLNILIDETRHARLTDFGLLTIMVGTSLTSTVSAQAGTVRWMSPELIEPKDFGFETSRHTKESDCYALGIVIYEVISGNLPFHSHRKEISVALKVLKGNRPSRDAEFPDPLWEMLQLSWMPQPSDRPEIRDVLRCLERVSGLSRPASSPADQMMSSEDTDDWNSANESSGSFSSTEGDPHHLGSPYYTELHDPQSAVNQMAATPETPPPSEPHPTANRRPVGRCSNCGQTGHRKHAQRCPKYASDPLHHSKVAFCVEPKRDLIMSHPGGRRFKYGPRRGVKTGEYHFELLQVEPWGS